MKRRDFLSLVFIAKSISKKLLIKIIIINDILLLGRIISYSDTWKKQNFTVISRNVHRYVQVVFVS